MVGMKPTDVVPSAAVKFFGAGTAACIADLVTFPLDTAKVRLQVRHTRCLWWPQILQHSPSQRVSLNLPDPGRVPEGERRGYTEVSRSDGHHHHHGTHWGAQESLQWPGGGTPEADELRLRTHRPVWLHEAVLHPGHWQWASAWCTLRYVVWTHSLTETNLLCATQAPGLWPGSWRAALQVPWLWLSHNPQMWWRCDFRLRCDCLTAEGGTTAPWTPTRPSPETRAYVASGKVLFLSPLKITHSKYYNPKLKVI